MQGRFKFRGMTLGGEWVYGNLAIINEKIKSCGMTIDAGYYISNKVGMPFAYPVRPETIGQCTGLKDKNDKFIYEGDILGGIYGGYISQCDECKSFELFAPEFGCASCSGDVLWQEIVEDDGKLEVIGNIHENPDFL